MADSWNSKDGWGTSLNKGFSSSFLKRLQDDEDERLKKEREEQQKKTAETRKEEKGSFWKDASKVTKDLGASIGAGLQQGAARVGDVALKGGALLDEAALQMSGKSEGEKDKQRIKNVETTEMLRNKLKEQKDIKGENLKGSKDIGTQDLKSARGVAELAGESLGTAIDATSFINPTALLTKGAAKEGGKLAAKDVLKTAGRDAAFFGGADAAAATANTYGETGDVAKSLETGAKTGLLTAATQGALDLGGAAAGRLIGGPKKTPEAPVTASAVTPEGGTFSKITDDELNNQLELFKSGEGRTGDVQADYARYQELKDEATSRARNQYYEAGGLSPEQAKKALDDLDAGNIPETAYKPAEPVKTLDEVIDRPDVPAEIKRAAAEVADDRAMVSKQMEGLMSPQTKAEEIARLDEKYDAEIQNLTRKYSSLEQPTKAKDSTVDQTVDGQRMSGDYKSDIRFQMAKEQLDNEYRDATAELDMLEAQDLPEVEKYSGILNTLAEREQNIVMDTRTLMKSAPDQFRDVDQIEFEAQRAALEKQLEDAQRFGDPNGIVTDTATSPDPVTSFNKNPDAPTAYRQELTKELDKIPESDAINENFKNIKGIKLAAIRLMSPSQVLEKMGLRGEAIDIHSNLLKAESKVNLANREDSEILTQISKILPDNPQAQRQIVDYLEGSRKTLDVGDQQSADMIRAWLDEKKAGLNKLGFKTLDEYFPHMFDKKDPEVQRLFKGKTTGDIAFGNLKQRTTDSDDYSRDVMNVLTSYASSYNRKVYLEPALKPLDDLKMQKELSVAEAKWVDGYIEQLKGFDKSMVGDAYNSFMDGVFEKVGKTDLVGKDHYTSTLGTQRMVSAVATMGLNPGTAIRNMTQMVNTVADIGPRYSTIGAVDGLRMLTSKAGREELQRVGIMEGGVSQNYFDAITKPGIRGNVSRSRDTAVKGMMMMIRATDISLRAQAYAGAKALATAKGLTGEAAENFAVRKVVDTQFITSRVDMPLAFNGQGVRSLSQLATFSGKQAGFLKRTGVNMIKDSKTGHYRMDPKAMGSVMSAVIVGAVATEQLKELLGFRETEWIPFYDQIAPFAGAITGQEVEGGDSLYRSPLVRLLAGDGKSKIGLIQALQGQDTNDDDSKTIGEGFGKFMEDNWSQIIPAGTQIKKTQEGYETTSTGESVNSGGKIRYLQDMDADSQLKASLFGQYATEAGQNWIKSGFPTLSESQTATVDGLKSRAEKEQYVDFYQTKKAANGRQKAYDAAKEAAASGNQERALEIADEYNAKLDEAMSKYYENHEELPQELQDELDKAYISVSKIEDNLEEK